MMFRNLLTTIAIFALPAAAMGEPVEAPPANAGEMNEFSPDRQFSPKLIQSVGAGYDLWTLRPADSSTFSLNGFNVAYTADFLVSRTLPLYVGTGMQWGFFFRNKTYHDSENYNAVTAREHYKFVSMTVPVNVSYRVPVTPHVGVTPLFGLDFRVQVYGNRKTTVTTPGNQKLPGDMSGYEEGSVNLFSKERLGNDALRRFQLGWHAGLKFHYDAFLISISYGTDFVKLRNELGSSNLMVNVGYLF